MMLIYAHVPHCKVMYNYRARLNTNFCMHYHRLSSIIISYHDLFNRALRFAESLRMRRYSNITVPIALESVSDANQKRCKFAPDTMIAPKLYRYHGRWCWFTLMFLITRLCTTIARVWTRTFVCIIIDYHRLSSAIIKAETTVDYHQLWWSF